MKSKFSIVIQNSEIAGNPKETLGQITIGDFMETFTIALNDWSIEDYKKSWRCALQRLIEGCSAVGLMVWMHPPQIQANRRALILYRKENAVFVQDRLFPIGGDVTPEFDEELNLINIGARKTIMKNGMQISEWKTDIDSIRRFLDFIQSDACR